MMKRIFKPGKGNSSLTQISSEGATSAAETSLIEDLSFLSPEDPDDERRIQETINCLVELFLESNLDPREVFAALGKEIILYMTNLDLDPTTGRQFQRGLADQKRVFRAMNQLFTRLGEEQFAQAEQSIKSEFAVAKVFRDQGWDVLLPTPKEDVEDGVDLWVKVPESDNYLKVQVKVRQLLQNPPFLVWKIEDAKDLKLAEDNLVEYIGRSSRDLELEFLQNEYENAVRVMILVPSDKSSGEIDGINMISGLPTDEFAKRVYNEVVAILPTRRPIREEVSR